MFAEIGDQLLQRYRRIPNDCGCGNHLSFDHCLGCCLRCMARLPAYLWLAFLHGAYTKCLPCYGQYGNSTKWPGRNTQAPRGNGAADRPRPIRVHTAGLRCTPSRQGIRPKKRKAAPSGRFLPKPRSRTYLDAGVSEEAGFLLLFLDDFLLLFLDDLVL